LRAAPTHAAASRDGLDVSATQSFLAMIPGKHNGAPGGPCEDWAPSILSAGSHGVEAVRLENLKDTLEA
jgi:hypothetical protein